MSPSLWSKGDVCYLVVELFLGFFEVQRCYRVGACCQVVHRVLPHRDHKKPCLSLVLSFVFCLSLTALRDTLQLYVNIHGHISFKHVTPLAGGINRRQQPVLVPFAHVQSRAATHQRKHRTAASNNGYVYTIKHVP